MLPDALLPLLALEYLHSLSAPNTPLTSTYTPDPLKSPKCPLHPLGATNAY